MSSRLATEPDVLDVDAVRDELERMRASVLGLCAEYAENAEGGSADGGALSGGAAAAPSLDPAAARQAWETRCAASNALVERCCSDVSSFEAARGGS
jgi:hypothetical protein